MTAPVRIRLSRARGWRMPPNTVNAARGPGRRWGNPWRITKGPMGWWVNGPLADDECASEAEATALSIRKFRHYASTTPGFLDGLRGKNLACWCALDAPCHADVLLELANP